MKKEQRQAYIELMSDIDTSICSVCRFHDWHCESLCSEGFGDGCVHPLEAVREELYQGMDPGADCWGFRPILKPEYIFDIIGIILANGWQTWMINPEKLEVAGVKELLE